MIWEGMVLGKDCIRKGREKNVDVTVGLTSFCVKKQTASAKWECED